MGPSTWPLKASVAVFAYNHEKFIAQAIESALNQKTSFDYEIVVGEDCSSDRTRAILQELERNNPGRIRLLLREKRVGQNVNVLSTMADCRGQYVAFLEGDDYWISPDKLQKQVDFLDQHADCSLCFHTVRIQFEYPGRKPIPFPPGLKKQIFTIEDLLRVNVMQACSIVYRNGLVTRLPPWFNELRLLDWPFSILLLQHGHAAWINETMAVYRVHEGGVWSMAGISGKVQDAIRMMELINEYLEFRYDRIIQGTLAELECRLAIEFARAGERQKARQYAQQCTNRSRGRGRPSAFVRLVMRAVVRFPFLYRLILFKKPLWK